MVTEGEGTDNRFSGHRLVEKALSEQLVWEGGRTA